MKLDLPVIQYSLDELTDAKLRALAQERHRKPEDLVREAVAKYVEEIVREADDEAAYQSRVTAIMAALKHPERDNCMFGAWRGFGIDGVDYQNEMRGK